MVERAQAGMGGGGETLDGKFRDKRRSVGRKGVRSGELLGEESATVVLCVERSVAEGELEVREVDAGVLSVCSIEGESHERA